MTKLRRFGIEAGPDGEARLARADDGAWVPYDDAADLLEAQAALLAEARQLLEWAEYIMGHVDDEPTDFEKQVAAFLAKSAPAE